MHIKLTRTERLKDLRVEKHLRMEDVQALTGISIAALSAYENDEDKDISLTALTKLAKLYNVSIDYLIGITENREEVLTPIEELHLSDQAIQVLKSGDLNTRLISEVITHPSFPRLLIDAEIYIDRLAESVIQSLNGYLESTRQRLINDADADPEDKYMSTISAAEVDEDEYFSHVVNKDLFEILKAIRDSHKSDRTTADQPAVDLLNSAVTEMKQAAGTPDEKEMIRLCRRLGISYKDIDPADFFGFIHVLQQSPAFFSKLVGFPGTTRHPGSKKKRKR